MKIKIIIAYIFSIGAIISLFIMSQQNKKNKLLICKLIADVCWAIHYFFLGAFGGVIPNFLGVFRELSFSQRGKKKFFSKIYVPIFFIAVNFTIGAFTFKQPINIIPICASALVTVALWLAKPKLTKILLLPVCTAFLIYDLLINPMSLIGAINEFVSITSITIALIKNKRNKKTTQQ